MFLPETLTYPRCFNSIGGLSEAIMQFITVAPTNQKNRHYIARRTIGGGYAIVATCTSEDMARTICAALNFENQSTVRETKFTRV